MREVSCVGYTPRAWDPCSLQSILDVPTRYVAIEHQNCHFKPLQVCLECLHIGSGGVVYSSVYDTRLYSHGVHLDMDCYLTDNPSYRLTRYEGVI